MKQSIRRFGVTATRSLYQASVNAISQVKALVDHESIACDWQTVPHARTAVSYKQSRLLQEEYQLLQSWDQHVEYLDEAAMTRAAPRHYRGGLCYHDAATINPALFCRELKRILKQHGVAIYERSAVQRFETHRGICASTEHGSVTASKRVLLATNAYIGQLGLFCGHIVPLQTHLCVTEPLTSSQLAQLGWQGQWSIADKRNLFHYYRLTPDMRLMYGGGKPLYADDPQHAMRGKVDQGDTLQWQALKSSLHAEFPALRDVAIVRQWSGTLAMNLQEIPFLAEVDALPGTCFFGGWSGHGVAMSIASGNLIAEYLLNGDSDQSPELKAWCRKRGRPLPRDPWRKWALAAHLRLLGLLDRWESAWEPPPKMLLRQPNRLCDTPGLMGIP